MVYAIYVICYICYILIWAYSYLILISAMDQILFASWYIKPHNWRWGGIFCSVVVYCQILLSNNLLCHFLETMDALSVHFLSCSKRKLCMLMCVTFLSKRTAGWVPAFPELSGKEWKIDTDQGETGAGSSVQKKSELSKPSRDADCPSGRICFIHF